MKSDEVTDFGIPEGRNWTINGQQARTEAQIKAAIERVLQGLGVMNYPPERLANIRQAFKGFLYALDFDLKK